MNVQELEDIALPASFSGRFSNQDKIIPWINNILRRLSLEGFLPSQDVEVGLVWYDGGWIDKPNNIGEIRSIMDADRLMNYKFRETMGKIYLEEDFGDKPASAKTISITSLNSENIEADVTENTSEEKMTNMLLKMTSGDEEKSTLRIKDYEENSSAVATMYPKHLSAYNDLALSAGDTGEVYSDFVIVECIKKFSSLKKTGSESDMEQEIPVGDDFFNVLSAGLRHEYERNKGELAEEAQYWQGQYEREIALFKRATRRMGEQRIKPRETPGFEQIKSKRFI